MKKLITGALALIVSAALLPISALAATVFQTETELAGKTTLASGVSYFDDARQAEYRLEYEPNDSVRPVVVYGSKVCNYGSFSSMSALLEKQGMNVIGGINGDYYVMETNQPLGIIITDSALKSSDAGLWAVGFRNDGTAFIGQPALSMSVNIKSETYRLDGINKVRTGTGFHLFTEDFSYTTKNTSPGWDIILAPDQENELTVNCELTLTVENVIRSGGEMALPEGKYVLSVSENTDEWRRWGVESLAPGDTVTLCVSSDELWNEAEYAIGSLMKLVTDGQVEPELEKKEIAPRSAVGIKRDGTLVLFTVDGRQSGYSSGCTVARLAERLAEIGCIEACIMDGGGSAALSALYVGGESAELVSRPSGGRERSVSTYIMLAAQGSGSGIAGCLGVRPEAQTALTGSKVGLSAGASDETGRAVSLNGAVFSSSPGGSVMNNSAVRCVQPGVITVHAYSGTLHASAEILSVDTPESIIVSINGKAADSLLIPPGAKADLDASASWKGFELLSQDEAYRWSVPLSLGTIDRNGVFTASMTSGSGEITVSAGSLTKKIKVTVGTVNKLLDDFEGHSIAGVNSETFHASSGTGAARLCADLGAGGSYSWSISRRPVEYAPYLHISVYGDGSRNMLFVKDASGTEIPVCALDFEGIRRFAVSCPGLSGIGVRGSGRTDICIDTLTASSSAVPDTTAPEISFAAAAGGRLTAFVSDAVDADRISVQLLLDGKLLGFSNDSGHISALVPSDGIHKITIRASDVSGNIAEWGTVYGSSVSSFADTEYHWSKDYVNYISSMGILDGADTEHFEPDIILTRELFARAVCLWLGVNTSEYENVELGFADNNEISEECLPYVRAAYALGILKGADVGGTLYFLPDYGLTRQQAMTVVGRIQGMGYARTRLEFSDEAYVQSWSRPYVEQLVFRGVISGHNDGRLDPDGALTRAQVAKVIALAM